MITETDQLSAAMAEAANIWPELAGQSALLICKILEVGIQAIEERAAVKAESRLVGVEKLAGSMDGVWPESWRAKLAKDWPS
jgi:hypothetical protein